MRDAQTAEGYGEGVLPQSRAVARRAPDAADEAQGLVAHHLALRVGQGVADVLAGAPEGAVVVAAGRVVSLTAPVDEHPRLLVGVEQPVAVRAGEVTPRCVDVDPEGPRDAPEVLALPGARPRRDRAVADAQGRVGDE